MAGVNIHKSMMQLPGGPYFPVDTNMEALKNRSEMSAEQKRKLETECKLAESEDLHTQLIDRIAGNQFQG